MTFDDEVPPVGQTALIVEPCTWYIDSYYLIGRERVIWMREHSAQLHIAGIPSTSVTGDGLRHIRQALAMSGMEEMTSVQRQTFEKQCQFAQAERERPLVDEAAEALLAEQLRAPLEQALHASLAELPTDSDLNRAMIKDKLEQWRSGGNAGKRAPWERIRPDAEVGVKVKVPVPVDSARVEASAALRQCCRRAR